MSEMLTVIKRIVKEDVSNRTTQKEALYEAITNSIQAKATHVICRLISDQAVLQDGEGNDIDIKKIVAIEVEDNGVGFNDANYISFGKYRTEHKIALGCKGVGRFVFLKLFDDVSYTSWLVSDQKKREFKLAFDFESEDLVEIPEDILENKTILSLKKVSSSHFGRDHHIDRRMNLDLSKIREDVLLHLIPTLYFCKKEGNQVQIEIIDVLSKKSVMISEDDIPEFKTTPFNIKNTDGHDDAFSLHYFIEGATGKVNALYCANRRSVCSFSSQGFNPQGFKGILLLESELFDSAVNNARNDFDIYPVQVDMFHTISWEIINRKLKSILSDLVYEEIPGVAVKNRIQLQKIQEERPYLMEYIEEEDLKIAGFINKQQIIKAAKKRFDQAKDNLLKNAGKAEYSDEELNEAIQLTQNELVAYIRDRVEVVYRLKTMLTNKERTEAVIHNLFMKKYTDNDEFDYFSIKRNNLWLLDDRFTSYSYAASDKMIKDVLDQVGSDNDEDRPDISLFFSQSPEDKEGLKSVIVELKSFDDHKKYTSKKIAGINQLLDYIEAFQKKEQIESTWAFLITDVDERFSDKLVRDGYKPLFSTKTPIYHRYYEKTDASIYVIGAESLICDAEARNKVFIDIINKQCRIKDFLGERTDNSFIVDKKILSK